MKIKKKNEFEEEKEIELISLVHTCLTMTMIVRGESEKCIFLDDERGCDCACLQAERCVDDVHHRWRWRRVHVKKDILRRYEFFI